MLRAASILRAQHWRYSGLATAASIAFGTWLLHVLGLLALVDHMAYDLWLRIAVALERPRSEVVLVEVDPAEGRREDLHLDLVRRLRDLGAERVVFTFSPERFSADFFEECERYPEMVFGRELAQDPLDPDATRLARMPPAAGGRRIAFAVAHVDPAAGGIHRRQQAWRIVGEKVHLSIEAAALPPRLSEELIAAGPSFLVHFNGGAGSLPTVPAAMVSDGRLIPEFIRGKWVLIGRRGGHPGLHTPTTRAGEPMSSLEYHGHALNTVLSGRLRRPLSPVATLLALSFAAVVLCALYQWTDAVVAAWIGGGVLAATAVSTHVGFLAFNRWLPFLPLALVQGGVLAVTLGRKAAAAGSWAAELLVGASSRLPERYISASLNPADCWPLIINMVHQTLDLDRMIFLETQPQKTTLREVKALNCSFADISERRRDWDRPPYLTAIEAGRPVRVESYLRKAFDREEQYLTPLLFGSEILGFWAFGVDSGKSAAIPDFESVIEDYATLIGELLHQRRQGHAGRSWIDRAEAYLTHERTESLFEQLKAVIEVLEARLRQVEGLLTSISTATVVYDLFGRVLHINDRMLEILEKERLNPHKITALDLLTALSEYDLGRARKILRHVIMDQQVITLPVTLRGRKKSRFVMHLHPLQVNPAEKGEDALKALSGKCVLCELVDTTAFTGLFEMKEKLTARLGQQLRNDLASIDLSSSLLGSTTLSADQRKHISQIIHDKVSRTMDVLVECQQYLTLDGELESVERFPVNSQEALAEAVAQVEPLITGRGIGVTVDQPQLMSFVLASGDNLRALFLAALKLLGADASDGGTIHVTVSESEDVVSFHFRNSGFGMPNDRFQEYLLGDKTLASEELRTLREGMTWAKAWGGEVEAASEVGVGTEVVVRLVKFL